MHLFFSLNLSHVQSKTREDNREKGKEGKGKLYSKDSKTYKNGTGRQKETARRVIRTQPWAPPRQGRREKSNTNKHFEREITNWGLFLFLFLPLWTMLKAI